MSLGWASCGWLGPGRGSGPGWPGPSRRVRVLPARVAGRDLDYVVLDIDATLIEVHSEEEQASPHFKGGFGMHPILCFLDNTNEGLAGILRTGRAGSNTAADHIAVLEGEAGGRFRATGRPGPWPNGWGSARGEVANMWRDTNCSRGRRTPSSCPSTRISRPAEVVRQLYSGSSSASGGHMGIDVHQLTPVQRTVLLTLYGRALDSRKPASVLGDVMAEELISKINYDFANLKMGSLVWQIAMRAKMLDDMARRFLTAHPDAVVVDLGAGLDSRMYRLAPPPTVDWYDVDYPEVIDLRASLFPEHARAHTIGASVTDPHWLDQIPAERPTMIVADGLMAWLSEGQTRSLLNRITDHFHSGELAFNEYGHPGRLEAWAGRRYGPAILRAAVSASSYVGFDDAHLPERWNPRLTLVEETSTMRAPEVALLPPVMRTVFRLSMSSRRTLQKTRILRYRF
jgi:O-methyltransferase involved in polyketide biosynthesis